MSSRDKRGTPHWTESSMVLCDYLKTSSQPMGGRRSTSSTPTPSPPVDIKQEQGHVSATTTGEKSQHLGGGFHVSGEGPNVHLGGKHTDEVSRLDAQANLGSLSLSHKTDDHEYKLGYNKGWGLGGRLWHGEQPGFGGDVGPVTFDVRDNRMPDILPPSKDAQPTGGQ